MKTHMSVKVNIWTEDITQNFTPQDMVKIYGANEILSCFTVVEILRHFHADDFLNIIGDDVITEYFQKYIKTDGAA